MSEQWKSAPGLEGYYEVSNEGRIRSISRKTRSSTVKGQMLKLQTDKDGYVTFHSARDGVRKHEKVHRLVALAFIPNPGDLPTVNHLDENKQNNRVDNLEWATHKGNINHGTAIDRRAKTKSRPVIGICIATGALRIYSSRIAAKEDGFSDGHISSSISGKFKQHKGHEWVALPDDLVHMLEDASQEALMAAVKARISLIKNES